MASLTKGLSILFSLTALASTAAVGHNAESISSLSSMSPPAPLAGDEPYTVLPAGVPRKIKVTDKPNDPAGKMVKMRYGPFKVPPNSVFSNLPAFAGGAKITKPCDECYIGAFQGAMEFEDGTDALVNSGMYMHHFVLVNDNKPDWLCGIRAGGLFRPQWIYNGGNERPPVRLNSKYKFGMRVDKGDKFSALGELMNMSNETKTVYTTVVYEVIPIDTPGYREATHLRIDGWLCGASDLPAKKGYFQYHSPNWTSPYSGVVLHNDGHGHDGVTDVKLYVNGKVTCNSVQYYGLRPGWVERHPQGNSTAGHGAMTYISDAVACEDEGRIEKGDVIVTEATYNDTQYPQMTFNGHLENQMAINFLYIGRDENTLKDKLKIQPIGDQLPTELGSKSGMALMAGMRDPKRQPFTMDQIVALNLTDLLIKSNIDPKLVRTALSTFMPAEFDLSDPFATIPFSPPNLKSLFSALEKSGLPNPLRSSSGGGGGFQFPSGPDMFKAMPGFPKDVDWSKIFVPGGIIMNEFEDVMDKYFLSLGMKNPMGHKSAVRTLSRRAMAMGWSK